MRRMSVTGSKQAVIFGRQAVRARRRSQVRPRPLPVTQAPALALSERGESPHALRTPLAWTMLFAAQTDVRGATNAALAAARARRRLLPRHY